MNLSKIALLSLVATSVAFAAPGNGAGTTNPVPDNSSSFLLLAMGVVASLLAGRKFLKK